MEIQALQHLLNADSVANMDKALSTPAFADVGNMKNVDANPFLEKLMNVNGNIQQADQLTQKYIQGEPIPVHQLVIAMNKAKSELQLMVEVRNKILEVYQEVSKIQI